MSKFNPEHKNNKSVRHSDVEVGFVPEFKTFSDLPSLAPNVDVECLLQNIKCNFESENWQNRFQAMSDLRALYKNMPNYIDQIMQCFYSFIVNCLNDPKSSILKATLIMLSDVFEHADKSQINYQFTSGFLNQLISKSVSCSNSLRSILDKCLNYLMQNCQCELLLQQLCELSTNSNKKIGYFGFQYLAVSLNNVKDDISVLDQNTNQMIFKTCSFVLECQQYGDSKYLAKNILKFYLGRMSDEGFKQFLTYMIGTQFISKQEAIMLYNTATKEDKINYPRLSTYVEQNKFALNQPHQSMHS
jgi:hypothetical protein